MATNGGTRDPEPEQPSRPPLRRALITALLALPLLLIWGGASGFTVLDAYRSLNEARDGFASAERELRDAELANSRTALDGAVEDAAQAAALLERWYLIPWRVTPVIGPNLRTATVLSATARDGGAAASDLLATAAQIVGDDRDQVRGEISVDYVSELGPPTRRLADVLVEASRRLHAIDDTALIRRVAAARSQFLDLVDPYVQEAQAAADLLEILPDFLGEDEPRTYLVGAGALSELRASGGLLGSWSILHADGGHLRFAEFVDNGVLPIADSAVAAPSADYERRYGSLGALSDYRNVTLSPDFPSAAEVAMRLFEEGGGGVVDGVITADTVVFERLAERAGGLEVPGIGRMDADEVLRFVGLESYDTFDDDDERKAVLGGVATAAFEELFEIIEDRDVPASVEMLASLVADGHLLFYSGEARIQERFVAAGIAGELPRLSGESPGLFVNNIAGNKIDWFARREIEQRIELLANGVTRSTIDVVFHNDAPTEGHNRVVLGPWTDITVAGDNLSRVTVTCGTACEMVTLPSGARAGGEELGRPMADGNLLIPAGSSRSLQFVTHTAGAWHLDAGEAVLQVDHLVQPTLRGTALTTEVVAPDGFSLVDAPQDADVRTGSIVISEVVSGRRTYHFRWLER